MRLPAAELHGLPTAALEGVRALGEVERLPELRIPGIAGQHRLLQPGHLRPRAVGGRRRRPHQIEQFAVPRHGDVGTLPVQRIVAAADGDDDALLGVIDEGVDDETGGSVMVFVHRLSPSGPVLCDTTLLLTT